jgi:hypothetical protein
MCLDNLCGVFRFTLRYVLGFVFNGGLKKGLKIFQTKYCGECLNLRDGNTKEMKKVL